ncbi:MAG: DNA topoisomerase IV subunit A, partial [Rhodocyclaceae bacterium]|nr:DNA topoisomerase IV subunit A [Rhodocyclaceae bacterium]
RQGHGIDPASINYKAGDFPHLVAESRTVWPLVIIDTLGRAYSLRVAELPGGRGDGVPVTTMIELQDGAKMARALTDAPEARYLFANSGGYGFVAAIGDLVSRNRSGKGFMTLAKGEKPLVPAPVAGDTVGAVTQGGRLLVFPLAELKEMAKGRGLVLLHLAPRDELAAVAVGDGKAFVVEGAGRGGKAAEWKASGKDLENYRAARARKGHQIPARLKPAGLKG